ncbi:MAG: VOC family protein [Chloroflexi bacterium]|nr:VOC family protein [Chloroflexota bacterium]
MIKKLDHVAIAVKSITTAMDTLEQTLGLSGPRPEPREGRGMKIVMLPMRNTQLELFEPVDPQGAVASFLDKTGEGMYHICLEVDSVDETLSALATRGVELTEKVSRSVGFAKIAFLPPQAARGVVIELMERVEELVPGPQAAPSVSTVIVAVKDLEQGIKDFSQVLGIGPSRVSQNPHISVRNALFPVGDTHIELMQPTSTAGALVRFLERQGEGLYSLFVAVENFDAHLHALVSKGIAVTEGADPSRRRGFLSPKSTCGVLVEFHQRD